MKKTVLKASLLVIGAHALMILAAWLLIDLGRNTFWAKAEQGIYAVIVAFALFGCLDIYQRELNKRMFLWLVGTGHLVCSLFCFALLPYLRILDGWQYYIVWHAEICMWLYLVLYILIMIPILKFTPKKKNDL